MNIYILVASVGVAAAAAGSFLATDHLNELDTPPLSAEAQYEQVVEQVRADWRMGETQPR
ncbi:MAG: hypothetical protein AAGM38_00715 [Pseudomonadota bacterium]